jgi:phosphodiesterase/alkaline phosphatase D-like protein
MQVETSDSKCEAVQRHAELQKQMQVDANANDAIVTISSLRNLYTYYTTDDRVERDNCAYA